jgi:hypothetical protein
MLAHTVLMSSTIIVTITVILYSSLYFPLCVMCQLDV